MVEKVAIAATAIASLLLWQTKRVFDSYKTPLQLYAFRLHPDEEYVFKRLYILKY